MSLRRTGWFSPFLKLAKQKTHHPGLLLAFLLVIFSLLPPLFLHTPKAVAATQFACGDSAGSKVVGPTVVGGNDRQTYDGKGSGVYVYTYKDSQGRSHNNRISTVDARDCGTANVQANYLQDGSISPIITTINGFSASTGGGGGGNAADLKFNWVNSGEIDADNSNVYTIDPKTTTTTDGQNIFYQSNNDEGSCKDTVNALSLSTANLLIKVEAGDKDEAISKVKNESYNFGNIRSQVKSATHVGDCWVINAIGISLGNQANATKPPTTASNSDNSCEAKGGDLSWGICPIVRMVGSGINWVDTQIQALLQIDKSAYGDEGLHQAWAQIRNIAYIILVPIMLVMVISTALGFSFVDAYTVRKALPRMIIAIVFIALSWEICQLLIDISNVVGAGVMGIMTLPFKYHDTTLNQVNLANLFGSTGGPDGILLSGLGLAALTVGLLIIIWLFGSALLLAAGIGLLVLLLRQLMVVGLVLVAPLAILAWIFPGNDKMWKYWWSLFSKLLLMFPLIMALLAVGRDFAVIIKRGGAGDVGAGGPLTFIAIMSVWLLPYAFIPLTFRFAGGVFANLTGMVNDRSKGLFDRFRQTREGKRERAGQNRAFSSRNPFTRSANTLFSWGVAPVSNAKYTTGMLGGKGIRNQVDMARMDHTQKLAEVLSKTGMNDKAARALAVGAGGKKFDGTLGSINALATELGKSEDPMDQNGAQWLRQNASFLTGAYKNEEYGRASVQGAAALGLASQGFITPDEVAQVSNDLNSRTSGFGNSMGTMLSLAGARGAGTRPGYTARYNSEKKRWEAMRPFSDNAFELAARTDTQAIGGMKGGQFSDNLAPAMAALMSSKDERTVFDKNGVEKSVYTVDVKNQKGQVIGQKEVELAKGTKQAVEATLLQAYGTYTSADVRTRVRDTLIAGGMDPDDIDRRSRGPDLNERTAGDEAAPPPPGTGTPTT